MSVIGNIKKYLQQVTGDSIDPQTVADAGLSGLPAYLAQIYSFYRVTLFHRELFLAIIGPNSRLTPGEIERDIRKIQSILGVETAVVLMSITSYDRQRLIQKKIPFIVPERQMFLPVIGVDFREYALSVYEPGESSLSGISQLILLHNLQMNGPSGLALREVARKFNYSAMAVTKAVRELSRLGLCHIHTTGREKHIGFLEPHRRLWDKARHIMKSPIKRTHFVKKTASSIMNFPKSGMTALSELTNLSYEGVPILAVYDRKYRHLVSSGDIRVCDHTEDATVLVEEWRYDPELLARNNTVDPLSLCLSLADDPDERVQIAVVNLLENVSWYGD